MFHVYGNKPNGDPFDWPIRQDIVALNAAIAARMRGFTNVTVHSPNGRKVYG